MYLPVLEGNKLTGDWKYVLHFEQVKLPPVGSFWSVTIYDADGFQCANSLFLTSILDATE